MQSTVESPGGEEEEKDVLRGGDDHFSVLVDVLADQDCRRILQVLPSGKEPLTASDISSRCGIPLSTVYRKLRKLSKAGLVRESTELRSRGKHTSSYETGFDEVVLRVTREGFEAGVSPRN